MKKESAYLLWRDMQNNAAKRLLSPAEPCCARLHLFIGEKWQIGVSYFHM
jgi:hypothetical protein